MFHFAHYGGFIMMCCDCGFFCWIAKALLIIGGLNLGLVGIFNYNLIEKLFGSKKILSRIIYILIGLSAVLFIFCLFGHCA